jgi:hypothetical protein
LGDDLLFGEAGLLHGRLRVCAFEQTTPTMLGLTLEVKVNHGTILAPINGDNSPKWQRYAAPQLEAGVWQLHAQYGRCGLERDNETGHVVALFASLAEAEAALHALQDAGVPYSGMQLDAHAAEDLDLSHFEERAGASAPTRLWSLRVTLEPQYGEKAGQALARLAPFAIGRPQAIDLPIDDVDQGAIAWRHYVFESPAAADWAGESAGTTGFTGLTNSGVFASGAVAEGNPPAKHTPPSDERRSDAEKPPTSDTMTPKTSTDRSRPETELK